MSSRVPNNNLVLFFDGCHKIYYCEKSDLETLRKMADYKYDVIDGDFNKNLRELWSKSCPLRFVDHANFVKGYPEISQEEPYSAINGFATKLHKFFEARA